MELFGGGERHAARTETAEQKAVRKDIKEQQDPASKAKGNGHGCLNGGIHNGSC